MGYVRKGVTYDDGLAARKRVQLPSAPSISLNIAHAYKELLGSGFPPLLQVGLQVGLQGL